MDRKTILSVALGAVLATSLFASLIIFQVLVPAQPAQIPKQIQAPVPLQKLTVSGQNTLPDGSGNFIVSAGKDRGIWANNGLDFEYVGIKPATTAADIKEHVAAGIKIGINVPGEVLLARSNGVPVKVVAAFVGEIIATNLYVKGDSPLRKVQDLDGKKIGVFSTTDFTYRLVNFLSNKFAIKPEIVQLGNVTNQVVAIKLGSIDAFVAAQPTPLRLVDTGELRILVRYADLAGKPFASNVIWATEDVLEQNPALVRTFVKAWLQTVRYVKDNQSYAADLYVKITNAPRDVAETAISLSWDWQPSGKGSGSDLMRAVANSWQFVRDSGAIPYDTWEKLKVEDAIDVRFLP